MYFYAGGLRALDQQLDSTGGEGQPVARYMQSAQDVFLIQEGVELLALIAGKDLAFDSPRCRVAELPLQVGEAGLGSGNFQAAYLVEAADAVLGQRQELFDRVFGECCHGLGGVGLEDQSRGVGRGAPGHVQRSLVQDGDVVPAAGYQFICQVGADDPSSDDDYAWRRCHVFSPADSRVLALRFGGLV